jgi:hypothetical protein
MYRICRWSGRSNRPAGGKAWQHDGDARTPPGHGMRSGLRPPSRSATVPAGVKLKEEASSGVTFEQAARQFRGGSQDRIRLGNDH